MHYNVQEYFKQFQTENDNINLELKKINPSLIKQNIWMHYIKNINKSVRYLCIFISFANLSPHGPMGPSSEKTMYITATIIQQIHEWNRDVANILHFKNSTFFSIMKRRFWLNRNSKYVLQSIIFNASGSLGRKSFDALNFFCIAKNWLIYPHSFALRVKYKVLQKVISVLIS